MTLPYCDDVFYAVGLNGLMSKEASQRFYELIGFDSHAVLKYCCYVCDLRRDLVKERLKRYLLIDCGIRLSRTFKPDLRENDFEITRYYLEMLFDTWFTINEMYEMLNDEGFNIELNNF
ncbi:hypothetical protein GM418_10915 [Maribellus comscasis]|uniref:Uncharacterized protein n=1 Tax=Maribellus comscasis TaxID=2681766 RepID=A0A6I6JNX5_9BACT|nr:hypothetical protein [Maribellus comscasis]QGY44151.1 hypothetical protein GM418_10915 [Maribellus comscasis]